MKVVLISIISLFLIGNFSSLESSKNNEENLKCNNLVKNGDASQKGKFWKKKKSGALSAIDGTGNTCFALWHGGHEEGITQNVRIPADKRGQECMFSGWVKRTVEGDDRLGEPIIRVHFFDKNKNNIKSIKLGAGTKTTWELLSQSTLVPEEAFIAQIKLKVGNEEETIGGNGQGYFDNIGMSFCGEKTDAP